MRYQIIENKTFVFSGVDVGRPARARRKAGPQTAERAVGWSTVFRLDGHCDIFTLSLAIRVQAYFPQL